MSLNWKQILRTNFTDVAQLATFLELDKALLLQRPKFVLNLPRRLAQKIEKGTIHDPILRQFVPLQEEKQLSVQFHDNPVQDHIFLKTEKLVQKYQGRSLLLATSACAMHCRYCFRQNFPYETERRDFSREIAQLKGDETISEVILSGGDPLSLSDEILEKLLAELSVISHLKRIRFHTRFPLGIPERIDAPFLKVLAACPKQIWFVLHINHPRELDADILAALKQIGRLGIPLLNQSVLLRGVNDRGETLRQLSLTLVDHGIVPYYLHQLDPVTGSAHFAVRQEEGAALIQELTHSLSGYAVPRFVQEIPGAPSKTFLANLF